MRLHRLFRTSVFRLTLGYTLLFAASVGALSAFIYWSTLGYLKRQNNAIIEAEISGLSEQYERRGLAGLADIINERVRRDAEPTGMAAENAGRISWVSSSSVHGGGRRVVATPGAPSQGKSFGLVADRCIDTRWWWTNR